MIEFHGNAVAQNDVCRVESSSVKKGKIRKHIPSDVMAAATRSLRHAVTPRQLIDRIDHLVVHGDDVP